MKQGPMNTTVTGPSKTASVEDLFNTSNHKVEFQLASDSRNRMNSNHHTGSKGTLVH